MRILLLHNWYQYAGGEDNVVRTEMALLTRHQHEVALFDADNQDIAGLGSKLRAGGAAPHSRLMRERVQRELHRVRPDVAHVHNVFPLLTPAVLHACSAEGVPVVHTLHNFRLLCPAATLMRDGRPCELCATGTTLNAVRYHCYRGSYATSAVAAWTVAVHRTLHTFHRKVDRFIALTEFARELYVRSGFPADKIHIKPDATPDPFDFTPFALNGNSAGSNGDVPHALFLGRLSEEKGVGTLLAAWDSVPHPLRIAGAGPLAPLVTNVAGQDQSNVTYLGYMSAEKVHRELANAAFAVVPSQCYEGFGVVLVEAFSHGIPVLASNLGSMAEIVEHGVTGLLFDPGDPADLAAKATWLFEHEDERRRMGEAARQTYERKYTLEGNYRQLMRIYDEATAAVATRRG